MVAIWSSEIRMEPIEILLSAGELKEIDGWRFELKIDSREEAIRRLIKLGLKAAHKADESSPIITQ